MSKVTVYRYRIWNFATGRNVWMPHMATLETIRRLNGLADMTSATQVEESALDASGYLPAEPRSVKDR
jgi:hypothetical protein